MIKIKSFQNKTKLKILASMMFFSIIVFTFTPTVLADSPKPHNRATNNISTNYLVGGFAQAIPGAPNENETKNFTSGDIQNNPIIKWLNAIVNLLAGVIGVGAILMIVWGGIQYITARDNAQAVQSAKEKIINVVIGLAAFIFLYAFLQWLIPGGIFA